MTDDERERFEICLTETLNTRKAWKEGMICRVRVQGEMRRAVVLGWDDPDTGFGVIVGTLGQASVYGLGKFPFWRGPERGTMPSGCVFDSTSDANGPEVLGLALRVLEDARPTDENGNRLARCVTAKIRSRVSTMADTEWFAFSPEPCFDESLAVIAGLKLLHALRVDWKTIDARVSAKAKAAAGAAQAAAQAAADAAERSVFAVKMAMATSWSRMARGMYAAIHAVASANGAMADGRAEEG